MRAWAALLLVAACSDPITATVVTIDARPSVHGVDSVEITFANAAATLTETFELGGRDLPATFSVETPGRTGVVTMSARATDENGVLVALGDGTATIVPEQVGEATLLLDPADFVVNTSVAGSQRLAWSVDAGGAQIAAGPDGTFTVGFTDDCGMLGRCDLWGRRFDATGTAVDTEIQANDQQFNMNVTDVFGNDPALAVGADGTLLVAWTTFSEILAVAITPSGAASSFVETTLSVGTSPGDPSVAALPGGRFVVVWAETDDVTGERRLFGRFVDSTATPVVNPETGTDAAFRIDTSDGNPDSPAVAVADDLQMAFLWRDGSTIRLRFTSPQGQLQPQQQIDLATYDLFDDVWSPRIVRSGARFVASWGHQTFGGDFDDGVLLARTIAFPTGSTIGAESVVARGLPDSVTRFSLATQDGLHQIAWQACDGEGDGDGCGILSRAFRPTGLPIGPPVVVDTTIDGAQSTPSITALGDGAFAIAWTDESGAAPDTSETAIRARLLYPEAGAAAGVLGAPCGGNGDVACGDGLTCIAGSDSEPHCHATCDPAGPAPQCPDGGICTTQGADSGCVF